MLNQSSSSEKPVGMHTQLRAGHSPGVETYTTSGARLPTPYGPDAEKSRKTNTLQANTYSVNHP